MKTSELNIWGHHDACPWRHLSNWPQNIKLFFRKIKWSYQRITRGYCDLDTWDLDVYLLRLLRDSLHQLANTTHSYPGEFTSYNTEENPDAGADEWKEVLDKMSYLFHMSLEDSYPNPFDDAFHQIATNNFINGYNTTESLEDEAVRQAFMKCLKDNYASQVENRHKAFELLLKYFDSLWD